MTKNKHPMSCSCSRCSLVAEKSDKPCPNCGHDRVWRKPIGVECTRCKRMVKK